MFPGLRPTSLLVCMFALAGCAGSGYGDEDLPDDPPGGNPIINVIDFSYLPANLDITVGGTVRFNWPDGTASHSVTPSSANVQPIPANPGDMSRPGPYFFDATFTQPGAYQFFCVEHGAQDMNGTVSGMSGTVFVQ